MEDLFRWLMLGGFVLGTIFFIVLLVLSAKSWRVLHILAMLFVFSCAATFGVFFAMTTKTYTAWKETDVVNQKKVETARAEMEDLLYGEDGAEFAPDSLVALKGQLNREIIGRGRVWRNATAVLQDGNLVAQIPPSPDAEADQASPTVIDPESPMFVFLETAIQSASNPSLDGVMVPVTYLGEFVVESATQTQVVLRPTLVFYDPAAYAGQQWTVVLYEKMPGDTHDLLIQAETISDDPIQTREILQKEIFNISDDLFNPDDPNFDLEVATKAEALLDQYQFDGKTLGEIDDIIEQLADAKGRINTDFVETIEPNEEWLLVKFLKDHSVEVNAPNSGDDATDVRRTAVQRGFYDNKGLAISADLRLEEDNVTFAKDDTVLVDRLTGEDGYVDPDGIRINSLVEDEIVQIEERYFFRTLNDYPLLFRELNIAGYQLDKMLEEERRQTATMEVALKKADAQITKGEEEQLQLNADIENLQNDVDVAQAHLDKLASLLMARQQKINALFVQTQAMAQRKADLESGLVKEIDDRTEDAIQN
ncbi:MAG: hypothetical protein MK136_04585 [Pirellulaceae bacterium]|nr:hypothetical protein [Pirellulaceae bacterium]